MLANIQSVIVYTAEGWKFHWRSDTCLLKQYDQIAESAGRVYANVGGIPQAGVILLILCMSDDTFRT